MLPPPSAGRRRIAACPEAGPLMVLLLVLMGILVSGCGAILQSPPAATAQDFPGIASELSRRGVVVERIASGDAGCADAELARTAIRFGASGLDQPTPVTMYVYIFRDRATYDRRRQAVDACARSYVSDPSQLGSIDAPPYVLIGQGPWAPGFAGALRSGLTAAAGSR